MYKKTFLTLVVLTLALPVFAKADAPPPPPFTINFTYEGQKISDQIFYAETLRCDKEKSGVETDIIPQLLISDYDSVKGCTWESNFLAYGCANSQCNFNWTLGEFKLAVYIPSLNRTFVSGVINREYLGYYGRKTQTVYDVNLLKDNSVVVANVVLPPESFIDDLIGGTFLWLLILSLIATIILESIIALIFVLLKKAPKTIFFALLIGNAISVPFVWIIATATPLFPAVLYIVEIIAVVFEAWLIKMFSRKTLNWKMSLLISLIMNIVSFIVGP